MIRWFHVEPQGVDPCAYVPGLYTQAQVDDLINIDGYIPVANAAEFDKIRTGAVETMGGCSIWAGSYTTGGNKKYIQIFPIDFAAFGTWTTDITVAAGFVFDVNEFLINNITSTETLFGGTGLEIKNARFDTCSLSSTSANAALIYSGNVLTATNIEATNIDVVSTGFDVATSNIGGLFGDILGVVNVDGISFSGNVTGERNVIGGVFGQVSATSGSINNVSNSAITTVTCVQVGTYGIVGGLAGIIRGVTAENCVNNADISGAVRTGGVFGDFGDGSLDTATSCVNNGNISSLNGNTGGVSGNRGNEGNFISCVNNGNVTAQLGVVGGVCGVVVNSIIEKCVNYGNITMISTAINNNAGGIAGNVTGGSNVPKVRECFASNCIIEGGHRTGGIIGFSGLTQVSNCYTEAGVIVRNGSQFTAGLIGGTGGGGGARTLEYCYSAASIPSGTGIRGLVGGIFSGVQTTIDSYWDTTVGPATSGTGTGQTTAALQTPTSNTGIYSAWTIPPWDFGTDTEYPSLTTTP